MHAASSDPVAVSGRGVPRWLLFATAPFILAVGFVGGIALAVYRPAPPPPPPAQASPAQKVTPPAGTATPVTPEEPRHSEAPQPDKASDHKTGTALILPHAVDDGLSRTSLSAGPVRTEAGSPAPETTASPLTVKTRVDARAALAAEFSRYLVDGAVAFTVDYQVARDSRQNTVLVGIVKLNEYSEWVRQARLDPKRLQAWLKQAAERVRPAAQNEGFHLTWTIFEVVNEVPYGFAAREVTRTPTGAYVVTRPLAAVTDVASSTVAVASVADLSQGNVAGLGAPWATYGPVLRFDATDLYRPLGTTSNKP